MTERRIFAAILLLLAAGAGYLAFVLWRADESGTWIFLALTLFFAAMGLPMLKEPKPPAETPPTRFVSHRFMTLVMVVIVLGIIAAIVSAVLQG